MRYPWNVWLTTLVGMGLFGAALAIAIYTDSAILVMTVVIVGGGPYAIGLAFVLARMITQSADAELEEAETQTREAGKQ